VAKSQPCTPPRAALGTAKALGPPAGANKYTYTERWTAAQTLRSHTRSNFATPSPKWLKRWNGQRRCFEITARISPPKMGWGEKAAIPRSTRTIGEEIQDPVISLFRRDHQKPSITRPHRQWEFGGQDSQE